MKKIVLAIGCGGLIAVLASGCMDSLANQAKKDPNSLFGNDKKTDKIEKFDPNAKQQVSDSKIRADDPILYGVQALGPIRERIAKDIVIAQAVRLFEAENARYPKDHEEFMNKIIKANHIQLPALPGGWKYAYDVENHKLEVVRPLPADASPADMKKPASSGS